MIWTMLNTWRAQRMVLASRHRTALQDLPENLYDFWKRSARHEFPGIPSDAIFFARAAEGLMDFFDCVRRSTEPCALPSRAADSVWHAFERLAPIRLEAFCRKHFGRVIPHVQKEGMGNLDAALAVCLVRAREAERIPPEGPRLPSLFLLDRKLKMPNGFGYDVWRGQPGYATLNAQGELDRVTSSPPELAAAGLLGAGLIAQWQYAAHEQQLRAEREKQRNQSNDGGSSCGSSCGSTAWSSSSSSSCDSGGSDSSGSCDSGGSSCGSSCGGGGD